MSAQGFIERLRDATNAHDVDAIVVCFAHDYVLEVPCHPSRDFVGTEQVRRNWTGMFAAVPDLRVLVLREVVHDGSVWSEWEMSGTRTDGSPHLMRGVIVFEIEEGCARAARFFVEPVDRGAMSPDEAVEHLTRSAS